MPARDGTGPEGKGSKTGRGVGPCGTTAPGTDQAVQGASSSWLGRLFRRQRGTNSGRGRKNRSGRGLNR